MKNIVTASMGDSMKISNQCVCPNCDSEDCVLHFRNVPMRVRPDILRDVWCCKSCGSIVPGHIEIDASREDLNSILHEDYLDKKIPQNVTKFPNKFVIDKVIKLLNTDLQLATLDIGSGRGNNIAIFSKLGFDSIGLEEVPEYVKLQRESGFTCYQGVFPNSIPQEIEEKKYSVITVFETIYYFESLRNVFSWAADHLNVGGLLVIKTVNGTSPVLDENNFFARFGDTIKGLPQKRTLETFANLNNLKVIESGNIPDDILLNNLGIKLRRGKTLISRIINIVWKSRASDRIFLIAKKELNSTE
jgi:2-polyprenyl-3-methyl-5-hydroxy-6-metoxy-1,4-benzoquinol methylase